MKILKSFWISRLRENIVEDAVARGNEEKEPDEKTLRTAVKVLRKGMMMKTK